MDNIPRTVEEYRAWWEANAPVPYGYCWCSCGQLTNLAKRNEHVHGYVRGEPYPRIRNHHRRQSPHPYIETDMGYSTPCWVWQWSRINSGSAQYGKAAVEGGTYRPAHRVYYEQYNGPIPDGFCIHHLCCQSGDTGTTLCVNPEHLTTTTQANNVRLGRHTKLNAHKVREIRTLHSSGFYTYVRLAEMFEVNRRTIGEVIRGHTWRDA